jgi:hypothetical protein
MRRLLLTTAILLAGCNPGLAQVSTMGTTAMGIPSMPGAIVTSPLNGPSPFSATSQPGAPDTTLAPVPLATDPSTPGTVVTCSTPTGQITSGTPAVPVISMSAMGRTTGTKPSISAAPTTAMMPAAPLGTIPSPIVGTIVGSTTGTIAPVSPPGSPSTTVCSYIPGGPPANGADLPLATPEILSSPPLGAIQPDITALADTSIDPTMTLIPTPNSAACNESVSYDLVNPAMTAPANATGAAATPGVSSSRPSGC